MSCAIRMLRRAAISAGLALLAPSGVDASVPPPVDRVAFAPPAGASLPLDAAFWDEHGREVRLADYVAGRPAIVVPAYFGCSNLCGVVLNGVASALQASSLQPGRDLEVVVIGIDPLETPHAALLKKRAVLGESAAKGDAGWHFLTGTARAIDRVAAALGYRYVYDPAEHQYAHGSGLAIAAPGGRISGVLYGVDFAPEALRGALAAARSTPGPERVPAPARIAGAAQRWLLCFHYDPHTGRYSFAAMNAARSAGLAALLGLGGYVGFARRREHRQRQAAKP